jgi:hypothetical protein
MEKNQGFDSREANDVSGKIFAKFSTDRLQRTKIIYQSNAD